MDSSDTQKVKGLDALANDMKFTPAESAPAQVLGPEKSPESPDKMVADMQAKLQQDGVAASSQKSVLQAQLDAQQAVLAAKAMDGKKGVRMKQKGIAAATVSKNAEVEAARRIARTLAQNGPISIDDVTEELIKAGREKAGFTGGDKAKMWKGSIFRTSEWVRVHEESSRLARSHCRPVALWALKSWLDKNSLNGRQMIQSKFNLDGLRRDFERANPTLPKEHCHWFVGTSRLDDSIMTDIKAAGNEYQGVPVTFVPNAVGAIIQYAPNVRGTPIPTPPTTFRTAEGK